MSLRSFAGGGKTLPFVLLFILLFSGCGGGGSTEDTTTPIPEPIETKTAYLKDSGISGVTYTSGSQNGTTDQEGKFEYEVGDSVAFSIGGITLGNIHSGDVQNDQIVYPSDLLGIARSEIESNLTDPNLIRILRFLQSLDNDNDPSNGITIDIDTITALQGFTLDLSSDTTTDEEMESILNSLGRTLITTTQARNHFQATLISDNIINIAPTPTFESFSVYENSSFNGTLTATDPNSDETLSYTKVSDGSFGTLTISDSGNFTYTPNSDYNGEDSFSYKVSDGSDESETQIVTITILSSNNEPTANSVTINTNEDTPYTFTTDNFSSGFSDTDGDTLVKIQLTELPSNGTLQLEGESVVISDEITRSNLSNLTYTPNENYNGSDSFKGYGYDGETYSNEATMNISIASINDPVTISGEPTSTINEGDSYSFQCSGNDVDTDDTITYSITNKPDFLEFDTQTCLLNGSTGYSDSGTYSDITITASDGTTTDTLSFNLSVNDVYVPPSESTGYLLDGGVQGVSYSNGSQTRTTGAGGSFLYLSGQEIIFTIGDITLGTINTSSMNDRQVFVTEIIDSLDEGDLRDQRVTHILQFLQTLDSDNDPSNGITIDSATIQALDGLVLDFSNGVTQNDLNTVANRLGKTLVSANDALDHFKTTLNTYSIIIIENQAPTANAGANQTVTEGANVTLNGSVSSDSDGTIVSYRWKEGATTLSTNATFSKNDFSAGTHTVILTVTDNYGATDTDTVVITVMAAAANTANAVENQTSVLTVSATDPESDTITFSISGGADQAKFSIDANSGVLSFQSAPDFETPTDTNTDNDYIVEVTATDDGTGNLTDTQSITVTVTDAGEHYILNAVYDDQRTTAVTDDILYLYINEQIDDNTFNADSSLNYDITGTGVIGSNSTNTYTDTLFHRHKVALNSGGTASIAFVEDIDTINIKANQIEDANGLTTTVNTTATVKKFNPLARLKTGQTTSYPNVNNRDDGYYQATVGIARSYTDNSNGTVTDNATGLIWQKEDDNTLRNWVDAGTYCADLTLGGSSDWRLPTIEELVSITDKGSSNLLIDPIFTNTNSSYYWSSTTVASVTSNAWVVYFNFGSNNWFLKTNTYYVRCVRAADN